MENYTFVDVRPTVDSFKNYKGQKFQGLNPYDISYDLNTSLNEIRVAVPNGRRLSFKDFAPGGLRTSKSGTKQYLKVYSDMKVTKEENVCWFAQQVTYACVDVWRTLGTQVLAEFKIDNKVGTKPPKVVVQSGIASFTTDEHGSCMTFWVSPYTTMFRYDEQLQSSIPMDNSAMLNSGDAFYFFGCNVKTFDFKYNPMENLIAIRCFVNLNKLTWIDIPALLETVDKKDPEEDKKEKDAEMDADISAFIFKRQQKGAGKKNHQDHEFIEESQPKTLVTNTVAGKSGKKRKHLSKDEEDIFVD